MRSFELDADQQELARTVRRFLESRASVAHARALMTDPTGYDRDVWTQLADQLGVQGLTIPEKYGGAGAGAVELGLVLQELGRVLYSGPFLASAGFATDALLTSGDDSAMADLLPGLASGETIGTLAVVESGGPFRADDIGLEATRSGSDWTLTGSKHFVVHGHVASLILVAGRTPGGISLFAVDGDAAGLHREPKAVLDQTRPLASLHLAGTPGRLIGEEGNAWVGIAAAFDRCAVALAAETLGVADRVLEVTVQYAKDRTQFDRPIGSFQAIKHKCADVVVQIELARSAVDYATRAIDASDDDVRSAGCIALAQSAEACSSAAAESIQIHGGIGFTWEHDAHLYFKRARSNSALLGTVAAHRERLLQSIGV
jgi:alkylation response protein AidB-like acyl-CoA dehydrogenase